jgi:hypothetical protein
MVDEVNKYKEYLGDSVYANFDGYHIILTTENGIPEDPSNEIFLEPNVLQNIFEYSKNITKKLEERHNGNN